MLGRPSSQYQIKAPLRELAHQTLATKRKAKYAGWGSYVTGKFALAGLVETLVAELGIKATVVYPGPVRTGFLSKNSLAVTQHSIADYAEAQASLDLHLDGLDGKQDGGPEELAGLILRPAGVDEPPAHLFVGKIANTLAEQKIQAVRNGLEAWREIFDATDFAKWRTCAEERESLKSLAPALTCPGSTRAPAARCPCRAGSPSPKAAPGHRRCRAGSCSCRWHRPGPWC